MSLCCEAELDETTRDVIAMLSGFESDDEDDEEIEAGDNRLRTDAWRNSNETNPMPTTHALDGPSSTPSKGDTRQATRNDRRTCHE